MVFADLAEVSRAYESRQVELHAKMHVRIRELEPVADGEPVEKLVRYETTVGRALLSEILPAGLPFSTINKPLKKKEISKIINASFRRCGLRETVIFADKLMQAGYALATRGGISFAADDMLIPPGEARDHRRGRDAGEGDRGAVHLGPRHAGRALQQGGRHLGPRRRRHREGDDEPARARPRPLTRDGQPAKQESFNSIYMMADSGARGSAAQIRQLAGMRGLMAKPDGSIIETPITANFREGLNVLQYFISTHGARKGLADTALKTANSGYLTRRLVDVTQDLVVTEDDCGTTNGVAMKALVEGGEVIEPLRERILGRAVAADVVNPETQETLYEAGTLLGEDEVEQIETLGIDEVKVRTPLTCDTRYGLCATCYGRDLGRGHLVNVGEAVGVIAAQSIGEPGTQLTMRTFHIGGAASRTAAASQLESKSAGTVRFSALMRYVTNAKGELVVIARSGEVMIHDDNGRERERHKVPYGATLQAKDGDVVKAGKVLATWDATSRPIVTEYAGRVKFENVEEGVTVAKQVDEVTGLSTLVVIDPKRRAGAAAKGVRPQVKLLDDAGDEIKLAGSELPVNITFQLGSIITVKDGQQVGVGEMLARIPQETSKTRDITGGLPRVAELFEARSPKDAGLLAEVTGTVSFGKDTKGKQRLVITDLDGVAHEYLIPKDKHVTAHDGQVVNKGESIVDGPADPHDILRLLGRRGARALHHRRGAGRLPAAGREDQRQAHRGDRPADAAARAGHRRRRHALHRRRAGGALGPPGRERQGPRRGRGQAAGDLRAHAARHHQGVAVDRLVHLGGVVPGDDARADRGGDHGQEGRAARPEGERHRRPADPGGHGPRVPQCAQEAEGDEPGCAARRPGRGPAPVGTRGAGERGARRRRLTPPRRPGSGSRGRRATAGPVFLRTPSPARRVAAPAAIGAAQHGIDRNSITP